MPAGAVLSYCLCRAAAGARPFCRDRRGILDVLLLHLPYIPVCHGILGWAGRLAFIPEKSSEGDSDGRGQLPAFLPLYFSPSLQL